MPAWCECMRSRVGPEHNNMFVIYSVDVTLAGNSQAMRRETSLPHKLTLRILIKAYAAFEQAQKLIEKSVGMRVGVFVRVRMRCLLRRHAP